MNEKNDHPPVFVGGSLAALFGVLAAKLFGPPADPAKPCECPKCRFNALMAKRAKGEG